MATDNEVDEVIVTGYGSQKKKEITSAVAVFGEEEFNKGTINDASQLLQGKAAGLSIYNKRGNPNDDTGMDHKFRYLGWSIWNEEYNVLKLKEEFPGYP